MVITTKYVLLCADRNLLCFVSDGIPGAQELHKKGKVIHGRHLLSAGNDVTTQRFFLCHSVSFNVSSLSCRSHVRTATSPAPHRHKPNCRHFATVRVSPAAPATAAVCLFPVPPKRSSAPSQNMQSGNISSLPVLCEICDVSTTGECNSDRSRVCQHWNLPGEGFALCAAEL
jgi:hypothetical protein